MSYDSQISSRVWSYEEHQQAMAINRGVGIGTKAMVLMNAGVSVGEVASGNIKMGIVAGAGSVAMIGLNWFNNKLRDFGENMIYEPPARTQHSQELNP